MRLIYALLAILIIAFGVMLISNIADTFIKDTKSITAQIDSSGPDANLLILEDPGPDETTIVEMPTKEGEEPRIYNIYVSGGKIIVRVYNNTCIAIHNSTWSAFLVNDGSDGSDIVYPYKEFQLWPGKYYWRLVDRPRPPKYFYEAILSYTPWLVLIIFFVLVLVIMYSYKR